MPPTETTGCDLSDGMLRYRMAPRPACPASSVRSPRPAVPGGSYPQWIPTSQRPANSMQRRAIWAGLGGALTAG